MNIENKYVCLEGIAERNYGQRFYTMHTPKEDATKSATGETWYRVLGYADTSEEALIILGFSH